MKEIDDNNYLTFCNDCIKLTLLRLAKFEFK